MMTRFRRRESARFRKRKRGGIRQGERQRRAGQSRGRGGAAGDSTGEGQEPPFSPRPDRQEALKSLPKPKRRGTGRTGSVGAELGLASPVEGIRS